MLVADVGAGTGFMAAGLAGLVQRVYVLDGSPAMLDEARRNLARFTNSGGRLVITDMDAHTHAWLQTDF